MTEQYAWNLSDQYSSLLGEDYRSAFVKAKETLDTANRAAQSVGQSLGNATDSDIEAAATLKSHILQTTLILHDLETFADCLASLDCNDQSAQSTLANIQECFARLAEIESVLQLFELHLDDSQFTRYSSHTQVTNDSFGVHYFRSQKSSFALSVEEEKILASLASNGFHAWGRTYQTIAGSLRCQYVFEGEQQEIGLAEASGLLQSNDPELRHAVWNGISQAWKDHQQIVSGILNALSGWRVEVSRKRSQNAKHHPLTEPLYQNRFSVKSLNALMEALRESKSVSQNALRAQAKLLKCTSLHPADLMAPCPGGEEGGSLSLTDQQATEMIKESLCNVSPAFADFMDEMINNRGIETRKLPNKRPGAYCTLFYRTKSPMVFMTFLGGTRDLKVLAHELGHAFHCWAMKELPFEQTQYPMTLAETASNVGEMLLSSYLLDTGDDATRKQVLWQEASDMAAYLLHIPTRFDFESALYKQREDGENVDPAKLGNMLKTAWEDWFGTTTTEPDSLLWANKQHFYLTYLGFYNFPYACGYLMALRVIEKQKELGSGFFSWYCQALCDTGRMTVKDFVSKHFGESSEDPLFWKRAVLAAEGRVAPLHEFVAKQ